MAVRRQRAARMLAALGCLVFVGSCSAPHPEISVPGQATRAAGVPIVVGDPDVVAKDFASGLGQYDPAVLDLVAQGSDARVYADGAMLIHDADPARNPTRTAVEADGGWRIGDAALLSDFTFDSVGAIAGFSRNGIPIDTIVAPGDGTEQVPDGDDDSNPQLTVAVHSVRDLSDNLGILLVVTNNDDEQAVLSLYRYVAGDRVSTTYAESDGIAPPHATTFVLISVQGGQGGGQLLGDVIRPAEGIRGIVVDVPSLG